MLLKLEYGDDLVGNNNKFCHENIFANICTLFRGAEQSRALGPEQL